MQTQHSKYKCKEKIRQVVRGCVLIAFLIAAALLVWWLHNDDATDQATAYLALALLFVGVLQWDVADVQNDTIKRQLDHAEFQQRAWIATRPLKIAALGPSAYQTNQMAETNDWGVELVNTGHTPAIIVQSFQEPRLEAIHFDKRAELADIEKRARTASKRRIVLASGEKIVFRLEDQGTLHNWHDSDCEQVRQGNRLACLFGAFIYEDVFGQEHKTLCTYRYNRFNDQLFCAFDDGEMT